MAKKLITYAASYYTRRIIETATKYNWEAIHMVDIVQAFDVDHAIGIGHNKLRQLYPTSEGWTSYDVKVRQM